MTKMRACQCIAGAGECVQIQGSMFLAQPEGMAAYIPLISDGFCGGVLKRPAMVSATADRARRWPGGRADCAARTAWLRRDRGAAGRRHRGVAVLSIGLSERWLHQWDGDRAGFLFVDRGRERESDRRSRYTSRDGDRGGTESRAGRNFCGSRASCGKTYIVCSKPDSFLTSYAVGCRLHEIFCTRDRSNFGMDGDPGRQFSVARRRGIRRPVLRWAGRH